MGEVGLNTQRLSRRVVRAMCVFSGTQALTVLCSIVRTKLIAIVAGQSGIGLLGLYGSAIEMLSALSQMGVRTAGVREISLTGDDVEARKKSAGHVSAIGWMAGIAGAVLTVLLSPILSRIAFGDGSGTAGFCCVGLIVLFNAIAASRQAILQGTGRLNALARASVGGSVLSLFVSIPAILLLRENSIMAVLLIYGAVTSAMYMINSRASVQAATVQAAGMTELKATAKRMLRLGMYLTLADASVWLSEYLFMAWLRSVGGEDTVGLYQAGHTLSVKYVGMVFTAIAVEFYPRISAVADSSRRLSAYLNHELKVVLCAAIPAAVVFTVVIPVVVEMLYSRDFMDVVTFVRISVPATMLRAVAWCTGFVILAKGDGRIFMVTEVVSGITALSLNILLYSRMGLDGLGVAFAGTYLVYTPLVVLIVSKRYGVKLSCRTAGLLAAGVVICAFTTFMTI